MYRWLQVYIEMSQPVMAASLCLELGNALKVELHFSASTFLHVDFKQHGNPKSSSGYQQEMNRPGEAIMHYQRAAELQTQTPIEALLSMGDVATCKILTREYSLSFNLRCGRVKY